MPRRHSTTGQQEEGEQTLPKSTVRHPLVRRLLPPRGKRPPRGSAQCHVKDSWHPAAGPRLVPQGLAFGCIVRLRLRARDRRRPATQDELHASAVDCWRSKPTFSKRQRQRPPGEESVATRKLRLDWPPSTAEC